MPMHVRSRSKKMIAPVCFSLSLLFLFILSMAGIFMNTGPIILGTEMNTNGHVEYLCLGNGCDSYSKMFWQD